VKPASGFSELRGVKLKTSLKA